MVGDGVKRGEHRRILLKGGTLVTMNPRRDVGPGDLLIEDGRISGLGAGCAGSRRVDEVVDARGRLVLPGLIQPHTQLCQTLLRGGGEGLDFISLLRDRIWPHEAALDAASLEVAVLLGGAEALRTGTTTILDMGTVRHSAVIFAACARLGLRATIGKVMMDAGHGIPAALRETTEASLAESIALADRWHGAEGGRLRYAFAPRSAIACTEALLVQVGRAARARGALIHSQAARSSEEIASVRERHGMDNVAFLHGLGLTGERTVLAHCVWLTSEEQRILADSRTNVVHCPSSNLKLGAGIARVPDLLGLGINVALASHSAACGDSLDAFREMRLTALIHKPRHGPEAMPARTILELATLGGARALGLAEEVGSLEEGKRADITVVDARKLHAAPLADPYAALVFALSGQDVEHVFVDGVQRVRRGRVLAVDARQLIQRAGEAIRAIERRAL